MRNHCRPVLIAVLAISVVACSSGSKGVTERDLLQGTGDFGNTLRAAGTWPISGSLTPDCIQDGFGHRELGGKDDFHPGMDTCDDSPADVDAIAGNDNDDVIGFDVHAIADGVIAKVRTWDPAWDINPGKCPGFCRQGNYLLIEHPALSDEFGETVQTIYMHLAQGSMTFTEADVGSAVRRGAVLGNVGRSGHDINTTHLHFGLLLGSPPGAQDTGDFANPLHLLPYPKSAAPQVALSREADASVFDAGECPAADAANDFPVLRAALAMDAPALDLERLEVKPQDGTKAMVVDYRQRIGMGAGAGEVDDFQHGCVAVEVDAFNESTQTYSISFLLGGNWDSTTAFDVSLVDVRGNRSTASLSSSN